MALITYEMAKSQARLRSDHDSEDITRMMGQATAIVLAYIQDEADPLWDAETVDPIVQAAVLEVFVNLYRHRGDSEKPVDGPLTWRARDMLSLAGYRIPVVGVAPDDDDA